MEAALRLPDGTDRRSETVAGSYRPLALGQQHLPQPAACVEHPRLYRIGGTSHDPCDLLVGAVMVVGQFDHSTLLSRKSGQQILEMEICLTLDQGSFRSVRGAGRIVVRGV